MPLLAVWPAVLRIAKKVAVDGVNTGGGIREKGRRMVHLGTFSQA